MYSLCINFTKLFPIACTYQYILPNTPYSTKNLKIIHKLKPGKPVCSGMQYIYTKQTAKVRFQISKTGKSGWKTHQLLIPYMKPNLLYYYIYHTISSKLPTANFKAK
jgi:hypothetical protein